MSSHGLRSLHDVTESTKKNGDDFFSASLLHVYSCEFLLVSMETTYNSEAARAEVLGWVAELLIREY